MHDLFHFCVCMLRCAGWVSSDLQGEPTKLCIVSSLTVRSTCILQYNKNEDIIVGTTSEFVQVWLARLTTWRVDKHTVHEISAHNLGSLHAASQK